MSTTALRDAYLAALRTVETAKTRTDDLAFAGAYLTDSGSLATPGRDTEAYFAARDELFAARAALQVASDAWNAALQDARDAARRAALG